MPTYYDIYYRIEFDPSDFKDSAVRLRTAFQHIGEYLTGKNELPKDLQTHRTELAEVIRKPGQPGHKSKKTLEKNVAEEEQFIENWRNHDPRLNRIDGSIRAINSKLYEAHSWSDYSWTTDFNGIGSNERFEREVLNSSLEDYYRDEFDAGVDCSVWWQSAFTNSIKINIKRYEEDGKVGYAFSSSTSLVIKLAAAIKSLIAVAVDIAFNGKVELLGAKVTAEDRKAAEKAAEIDKKMLIGAGVFVIIVLCIIILTEILAANGIYLFY